MYEFFPKREQIEQFFKVCTESRIHGSNTLCSGYSNNIPYWILKDEMKEWLDAVMGERGGSWQHPSMWRTELNFGSKEDFLAFQLAFLK